MRMPKGICDDRTVQAATYYIEVRKSGRPYKAVGDCWGWIPAEDVRCQDCAKAIATVVRYGSSYKSRRKYIYGLQASLRAWEHCRTMSHALQLFGVDDPDQKWHFRRMVECVMLMTQGK